MSRPKGIIHISLYITLIACNTNKSTHMEYTNLTTFFQIMQTLRMVRLIWVKGLEANRVPLDL
jgi:hypothetical protein